MYPPPFKGKRTVNKGGEKNYQKKVTAPLSLRSSPKTGNFKRKIQIIDDWLFEIKSVIHSFKPPGHRLNEINGGRAGWADAAVRSDSHVDQFD